MWKDISIPLLSAVLAAGGGFLGATTSYWNKDRELDIRMVDVALTILSGKDEGTKTKQAKAYALDLLEKYGGVEIVDEAELAWANGGELPVGKWPAKIVHTGEPRIATVDDVNAYIDGLVRSLEESKEKGRAPAPKPLPENP
ncbi:MAG: hypothetical protein ACKVP5_07740 [Aestuariivirga sp.]